MWMLASSDDRIKITNLMEDACNKNRMTRWVCNNVMRNIHVCRNKPITNVTDIERNVIGYWYSDFINNLPYLRVKADKTQICSILSLYNGHRVTEIVFKELDIYSMTYLPLEYQEAFKHYQNALDVILLDESDTDLKAKEVSILNDMNNIESLLESVIPTYHNAIGVTTSFHYNDDDITMDIKTDMSDTSKTIFDTAVDFVIQFVTNAGARHWMVDRIKYADSIVNNDEHLKHINNALDTAKSFDYITPTKKHSVIAGGGVIKYDTGIF